MQIIDFQLWYSDFTGDERWQEIYDQQTGRSYYWNKRTNRTEWELPARPISSEKTSENPINLTFKRGTIDYNKLEKGKKVNFTLVLPSIYPRFTLNLTSIYPRFTLDFTLILP